MEVRKIMSAPLISTTPSALVSEAAAQMREHGVGVLVAMQHGRPAGIVTDRDIVIRALADGLENGTVGRAMSQPLFACYVDQDVAEVSGLMGDHQVRRLLVLDRQDKPVGMVSVGDITENASEGLAGQALGEISEER